MNEERLKVLKLLKEGRITMEEAEALLDALAGSDEAAPGRPREQGRPETERERAEGGGEARGRERREQRDSGTPGGWFDFVTKLDPQFFQTGLREAMRDIEQSLKDAFAGIQKGDLPAGIKQFFGKESAQEKRTMLIPAAGATRLRMSNRWGDVRLSGTDRNDITVTASVSAWGADERSARETAQAVAFTHYRQDETIVLQAELPDSGHVRFKVDFEIALPRRMTVDVRSMSGDIALSDLAAGAEAVNLSGDIIIQDSSGSFRVESKSGDIELLGTEGEVRARTLSGDLTMERVRSVSLDARTVSGDVDCDVAPLEGSEIVLESLSGDLRVTIPTDSSCRIEAQTLSGEIRCELPVEVSERSARTLKATLNGTAARLKASTKSGDVSIRDRRS